MTNFTRIKAPAIKIPKVRFKRANVKSILKQREAFRKVQDETDRKSRIAHNMPSLHTASGLPDQTGQE